MISIGTKSILNFYEKTEFKFYIFKKLIIKYRKKMESIEEVLEAACREATINSLDLNNTEIDNRVLIACQNCREIYNDTWDNIRNQKFICPCQKKKKGRSVTPFSNFKEALDYENYTTDYDGTNYSGSLYNINIKCKDGHEYRTNYNKFTVKKTGCNHNDHKFKINNTIPIGINKKYKSNLEYTIAMMNSKFGNNRYKFTKIPKDIFSESEVQVECNVCHKSFIRILREFLNTGKKNGCPFCKI
jgi:hypothetical protein